MLGYDDHGEPVQSTLGQYEHYWSCRQLRLGKDLVSLGDHCVSKLALGRDIVDGELNKPFEEKIHNEQDSFYKTLTPEQSVKAFRCEFDFDSPNAIDFDILVYSLMELKQG